MLLPFTPTACGTPVATAVFVAVLTVAWALAAATGAAVFAVGGGAAPDSWTRFPLRFITKSTQI